MMSNHRQTALTSNHDEHQGSLNNALTDKEKLPKFKTGSRQDGHDPPVNSESLCFQKLVSFYKENSSIPRFVMFPCTDCAEHFTDAVSRQVAHDAQTCKPFLLL